MSLSKPIVPTSCREWLWSQFQRGRFNVLLGSSGCGKSTALRLILSKLQPGRIKGFSGSSGATKEMKMYLPPCCLETEWEDRMIDNLEDMYKLQCVLGDAKASIEEESDGMKTLEIMYTFLFDDLGDADKFFRGKLTLI